MRAHSATLFDAVSATGNGSPVSWPGGIGVMAASGTFGATTLTLEFNLNGTWVSVSTPTGTVVAMTAAGMTPFYAPCGNLRGVLTSGSPVTLTATVGTASDG